MVKPIPFHAHAQHKQSVLWPLPITGVPWHPSTHPLYVGYKVTLFVPVMILDMSALNAPHYSQYEAN